ncbi:Vitellinogen, superhelical domain and Armadillo-like helical domain-containing protein [Strongyloides ratti]|uniref:Vitellinogen, superhelical domain and Armadillo-like helical domain-containing protein n=1 Tax=Strongyloides ratti TaxID=34506 RepID=A0A090LMY6_STRRB|nr:Vitellinogen, superhelical domain and Armadillo-like helical domain-containing protein [Strongyloides ratti]CEF68895.1 Vitellinogen, superhelical domain and Armadillo-like helical domain-containing protein [Strongyloides ratti]
MKSYIFFLLLFFIELRQCFMENVEEGSAEKPKEINLNFDDFDPNDLPKKTRLIFYKYLFKGETFVYEEKSGIKKGIKGGKMEAMFLFDVLHHDMGGNILLRLKPYKCHFGDCKVEDIPEIYLDVVQGYQNLIGYYVKFNNDNDKLYWNYLHGIAATLSNPSQHGEGDIQNVVTPQGNCRFEWYRPEDKKFVRKIKNCNIAGERNSTIVDGFLTNYNQEVTYHQNKKYDGDIVVCRTRENFNLKSKFYNDWSFKVESVSQIEMEKRDKKYMDRLCPANTTVGQCAKDIFGATLIGTNWKEIKSKFVLAHTNTESLTYNQYVEAYREELEEKTFSDLFGQIVASGVISSYNELKEALFNPENKNILNEIVDSIAAIGDDNAFKILKEVLTTESKDLVIRFAESIAYTSRISDKVISLMKSWLDETNDEGLKKILYKSYGLILRRQCELTLSKKNACAKDKDPNVNEFIKEIIEKVNVYDSLKILKSLSNTGSVITYAKKYICDSSSSDEIVIAALRILTEIDDNNWDNSIMTKLINTFRNTCPQKQSIISKTLAVDILLEKAKNNQNIASLLLRSETIFPLDNELWSYFYSALKNSRLNDEEVDELWQKMRSFKVFKENYGKQCVSGKSSVDTTQLSQWPGVKINFENKEIFENNGSLIYDSTKLTFKMNKRSKEITLFDMNTNGDLKFVDQSLEKEKLYNKNALLRFYQGNQLLLSGYNIKLYASLALQGKIFSYDDVLHSLYHLTLSGKISLYGLSKFYGIIDSKVVLKVPFEKINYNGCINLSEEPKAMSQNTFIYSVTKKKKKNIITRTKEWNGVCQKPKTIKMLETCKNVLS